MALRLELGLFAERVDDEEIVTRGQLDRLRDEVDKASWRLRAMRLQQDVGRD
jgi:hypothetical protein